MTLDAQRLWRAITASKPGDWFDAGGQLVLAEYCRCATSCERLAEAIDATLAAGKDVLELKPLLDMRDRESRRLGALGSKLRLLPVSRFRPDGAAVKRPPAGAPRPWSRGPFTRSDEGDAS